MLQVGADRQYIVYTVHSIGGRNKKASLNMKISVAVSKTETNVADAVQPQHIQCVTNMQAARAFRVFLAVRCRDSRDLSQHISKASYRFLAQGCLEVEDSSQLV